MKRARTSAVAALPCAERMHYSTEHLATNAARMIALSHHDPEPMVATECECADGWRITREGTGVTKEDAPHRGTRAERQQVFTAQRAELVAKLAQTWG